MDATQFIKSTNGTIITVGKPYLFRSVIYGDTAVHVTAISGDVIHFTIDGGEASRQVRDFPELSDGTYFALSGLIERRPVRTRKTGRGTVETPAEVLNTIREVPGVGKVALIENGPISGTRFVATPPELQRHIDEALPATTSTKIAASSLQAMSAMEVRAYAREHYSTIGKLTKKAEIIAAINKLERTEETF